jgi:hypothetical protein
MNYLAASNWELTPKEIRVNLGRFILFLLSPMPGVQDKKTPGIAAGFLGTGGQKTV